MTHDARQGAVTHALGSDLTIVVSTGERSAMVYDCLRSLCGQGVPGDVEVVVVDAGRRDCVDEKTARSLWPNLRLIPAPAPDLTKQRNVGTRAARGAYVCFLDDDTLVQPGWWPAILRPFEDERVAIVAGAVWCNPSPTFTDERGGYVDWLGIPHQVTHRSAKAPRDVEWSVGCNMAFRKSVWRELGGLCELYGFYDEDIDFGLRVRRAGYRVVFEPDAAVYHYCNTRPKVPVTKRKAFMMGRNRSMTLVRNYGLAPRLIVYLATAPWIQLWEALRAVARQCLTSFGHLAAHLAGMVAGLFMGWRHTAGRDDWTGEGGEDQRL